MGRDDWYRSEKWDDGARSLFEGKLARVRSRFNCAQYLRIQGLALTGTRRTEEVKAGRQLLERVIDGYRDQPMEVAGARFALAESLLTDGHHEQAVAHLRACLALEEHGNYRHGCELRLAEALVEHGDDASLNEAWDLLNASAEQSLFNREIWRIEVTRARLHTRTGDKARASASATNALQLLEQNEPQLPRHPTVGLVDADTSTVREMRKLAKGESLLRRVVSRSTAE